MPITISAIHYYPIKSCAGLALETAELTVRGLKHDREWMLVDENGRFITQREHPRMSLIGTALRGDILDLTAPGMPPVSVSKFDAGPESDVVVWKDRCSAIDQGDGIALWFSEFLQSSCRLVRMKDDFVRAVKPGHNLSTLGAVGFADGYPLLLISEASLEDLNSKLEYQILMNRFRPNVVVRGTEPFAEDEWKLISINGIRFAVVKPCARCTITTVDQEHGERGKEPLRTLSTYRKFEDEIRFGQNLMHIETGKISLGDTVEILEKSSS